MITLQRYTEHHPSRHVTAVVVAPNPFGGVIEHAIELVPDEILAELWDEFDIARACSVRIGQTVTVVT
jgi:hypothetical protein